MDRKRIPQNTFFHVYYDDVVVDENKKSIMTKVFKYCTGKKHISI